MQEVQEGQNPDLGRRDGDVHDFILSLPMSRNSSPIINSSVTFPMLIPGQAETHEDLRWSGKKVKTVQEEVSSLSEVLVGVLTF